MEGLHIKRPSVGCSGAAAKRAFLEEVVVGDGDMCSVGIAHKRHRKGASSKEERTEKAKEDEVYAGSKEKGRKTRKKLSGSKEKCGNRREKLFVPKAKAGNWKRKDMPRSDPADESFLIDELADYMLSAPPCSHLGARL